MRESEVTHPQAPNVAAELRLVAEFFHQVNRVLPADQKLVTFAAGTSARDAVEELIARGFSQAPVIERGVVLGVFSFRSFARHAARERLAALNQQRDAPGDVTVDECLEQFDFARVTSEMQHVFGAMDRDNGILIGTPERLQGILTPMDFLRYLYQLASPFVMMSEIELALRALMRVALAGADLDAQVQRSLGHLHADPSRLPRSLEEMTFDNYRLLIIQTENWPTYSSLLGPNRIRAGAKLKEIGELRNDLFHFKRILTAEDREVLTGHRTWLLTLARKAELRSVDVEDRQ